MQAGSAASSFCAEMECFCPEKRCFCLPADLQTRQSRQHFQYPKLRGKGFFREDSGADPALSSAGRDGLFPADFCTQVHDVHAPENAAQEGGQRAKLGGPADFGDLWAVPRFYRPGKYSAFGGICGM